MRRIKTEECCVLVVDLQTRLLPHMADSEKLVNRCLTLLQGVKLLGLPVLYTEQYPRGLGTTDERIGELLAPELPFEKMAFSCCGEPEVMDRLRSLNRTTVIIIGIEAHVCVLQTVLDAAAAEFRPVVVEDCIASRDGNDKRVALDRMRWAGGCITTVESLLFELTATAHHPVFRQVSKLIK